MPFEQHAGLEEWRRTFHESRRTKRWYAHACRSGLPLDQKDRRKPSETLSNTDLAYGPPCAQQAGLAGAERSEPRLNSASAQSAPTAQGLEQHKNSRGRESHSQPPRRRESETRANQKQQGYRAAQPPALVVDVTGELELQRFAFFAGLRNSSSVAQS